VIEVLISYAAGTSDMLDVCLSSFRRHDAGTANTVVVLSGDDQAFEESKPVAQRYCAVCCQYDVTGARTSSGRHGRMLDAAVEALALAGGRTRADFDNDRALALALTHLLQTIGEAARRVGEEFRQAHPEIPWKAIVGMRHKVVHDYLNVDEDVVWDTAMNEIPRLIGMLEPLVPPESA
jgi:uncharacterized protein with HEPN domain